MTANCKNGFNHLTTAPNPPTQLPVLNESQTHYIEFTLAFKHNSVKLDFCLFVNVIAAEEQMRKRKMESNPIISLFLSALYLKL